MMFVITRLSATVAVLAVVLAGAAACNRAPKEQTDVVSDIDRARAAVLGGDPVLKNAVSEPTVTLGKVRSTQLGWDRTQLNAQLYLVHTGPDKVDPTPTEVEHQLAVLIKQVRDGGWNVHWSVCVPHPSTTAAIDPSPSPSSSPSSPASSSASPSPGPSVAPTTTPPSALELALTNVPAEIPVYGGWEEVVLINKLADGVSYWGMLVATIIDEAGAFIGLVMRAPNVRDAANLLPASLPKLPAGSTCAEDEKQLGVQEASGEPVVMKDWLPFPAASKSPDPHRL
jgi:hypothetical protein